MNYKVSEFPADAVQALSEIEAFDIMDDERLVSIEDVCADTGLENLSNGLSEDVSVVSSGMVIDGNVDSEKIVSVDGRVNGNIAAVGDVAVNGLIIGDVDAENITFRNAKMHGNSTADGEIDVTGTTIIVGDLTAKDICVNSKVKGVITASNNVEFKANALVVGDVITGAIHMDENSRVNASIKLTNKNIKDVDEKEFDLGV